MKKKKELFKIFQILRHSDVYEQEWRHTGQQ